MILLHNVYGQVVFISIQYSMHQFTYNNMYFSCTHNNCHKCTCIYGTGGESTSHHILFRQELEISARKGSMFKSILHLCSHTTLSLGQVQYTDCTTTVVELHIIFFIMYLYGKYSCKFCFCSWHQQSAVIFVPIRIPQRTLPFHSPVTSWEL